MAVATPVIERRTYNQSIESEARSAGMTADELHNARMKDNLARLLNPENKIKDVVASIDADGTQVIQAAPEAVQAPERSVAPSVVYGADGIIARPASAVQTPALLIARWQTLTPREKEVASLIAQGLLNRDVGERLGGISIKTVQVHRGEVCRKLGVKGALGITRAVRAISGFDEAPAA